MADTRLVPLRGSERGAHPDARPAGAVDNSERIELTLVLRRRAEIPDELVEGPDTITREELQARYGADPTDIALVKRTAEQHRLRVTEVDPASRRIKISGTLDQLRSVVEADSLSQVTTPDPVASGHMVEHRQRTGELRILPEWDGVVIGVTGLDNRPQARPHMRRMEARAAHRTYSPPDLGKIYRFPRGTNGSGHTIGVVELGGHFLASDLRQFFSELGITPAPTVDVVTVGSGPNDPGTKADGEVMLDVEVIGALAPGARQVVYFAENTAQGYADAISTAVFATPTPTAVSLSWGLSEDSWTEQGRTIMNGALADAAALGVTVCAASGDFGSTDGVADHKSHTDFPASSPGALACGGTRLDADPATGTVSSETAWNDGHGHASGGGVSHKFRQPSWQANVGVPNGSGPARRGVPDVAADADPETGYEVIIHGTPEVIGGTSAVAPLWAALTVRLSEALGRPLGMLQPVLYAGAAPGVSPPGFRDITQGDIGAFAAAPGWDACTGLGVPDGEALLARLTRA